MTEGLQINITADNKSAITAFSQVQKSAFNLKEELLKYQSLAFTEKDEAKVQSYNRRIQELQVSLKQTTNAGKIGFDEMGDAIKNTDNPLTKAFSGVRQLAYILPGIGVAGLFNAAFEGLAMLATGLDSAKKRAREFADEYIKAMDSAQASSQKEIATVQSLVATATNEHLSRTERMRALKELNKEYPGYFTNLSKDLSDTDKLRSLTDQLSAAIIRKGNAEALAGLIGKENAKIWEAQHQNLDQQIDKVSTATKIWDYFKGTVLSGDPILAKTNSDINILTDSFKKKNEVVKSAQDNIKSLTEELTKNTIEQVKNNDFSKEETKLHKEKSDAYAKLLEDLAHIQAEYGQRIIDNTEYNKKSISAIDEATKHISLQSAEYKKAIALLDQYYTAQKDKSNPTTRFAQATDREFSGDSANAPTHLSAAGKNGSGVFDEDISAQADKRKKDQDEYNEKLQLTKKLTESLSGAFSSAIESGKNLGEALSAVFSDLAKQIERALVKALVFKAIGAIIGVATGGVGDLFLGALGVSGKGFAQGGLSTGPKSGHMEMLHGNEWVLRPEQLNGALAVAHSAGTMQSSGAGSQQLQIDGRLRGMDIFYSKQRTDYFRTLTTGK